MDFEDLIVVVDDSPAILTIVCALLKRHEFSTVPFRSGEAALEYFAKLGELSKVKAIYSDISMPGMGGIALLKAIRSDDKLAELPFVLISATVNKDLIQKAATMKVNGFLKKPITADTITKSVHDLYPERAFVKQRKFA